MSKKAPFNPLKNDNPNISEEEFKRLQREHLIKTFTDKKAQSPREIVNKFYYDCLGIDKYIEMLEFLTSQDKASITDTIKDIKNKTFNKEIVDQIYDAVKSGNIPLKENGTENTQQKLDTEVELTTLMDSDGNINQDDFDKAKKEHIKKVFETLKATTARQKVHKFYYECLGIDKYVDILDFLNTIEDIHYEDNYKNMKRGIFTKETVIKMYHSIQAYTKLSDDEQTEVVDKLEAISNEKNN